MTTLPHLFATEADYTIKGFDKFIICSYRSGQVEIILPSGDVVLVGLSDVVEVEDG